MNDLTLKITDTPDVRYTLVTGACGGLGGAFTQLLAQKGEPLFLTGRSGERLKVVVRRLKEEYPDLPVLFCACDLTDARSRAALFACADEAHVRFRRLVYVAGADIQKPFSAYTQAKAVFQARVNFEGAVTCMLAVSERCDMDGTAEFLTVGSVSGIYPMPYFALYSATKKALEQFSSALRTEWRGKAKVTCLLPGAIPTRPDVIENIRTQGVWGKLAALPPEKVAKAGLNAVRRNRRTVIVGFWNKIMRFATALVPLSVKMRWIARRWSKTEKDAF